MVPDKGVRIEEGKMKTMRKGTTRRKQKRKMGKEAKTSTAEAEKGRCMVTKKAITITILMTNI